MAGNMMKIAGAEFATIMARAALPAEALATLRGYTDAAAAINVLETSGLVTEAVRVLAHALPKREAVWWSCMCAAHTEPADLAEPDRLARETAELWVRQQKDEQRRAAMAHAQSTGFQTPEAWSAVAAFWSGESMAPPDVPAVPPPPHAAGQAVAGAVTLSSVRGDAKRQAVRLQRFLASGRDIASGGPGRLAPEER